MTVHHRDSKNPISTHKRTQKAEPQNHLWENKGKTSAYQPAKQLGRVKYIKINSKKMSFPQMLRQRNNLSSTRENQGNKGLQKENETSPENQLKDSRLWFKDCE